MNKKIITISIAAVIILMIGLFCVKKWSVLSDVSAPDTEDSGDFIYEDSSPFMKSGSARLFGQIVGLQKGTRMTLLLELVEDVRGQDAQEQAALVDGECTLEQIEMDACLSSPFYFRKTGKTLALPLSSKVEIQVYARESGGAMLVNQEGQTYMERLDARSFILLQERAEEIEYLQTLPYEIQTERGEVVQLKEKYIP